MDSLDPVAFQVGGGFLLLTGLFVLREIISGAMKEVGKDVWGWVKTRRAAPRHRTRNGPDYG